MQSDPKCLAGEHCTSRDPDCAAEGEYHDRNCCICGHRIGV